MTDMGGARHWDENNSRSFLDYGRYFVPERERQIGIIADLIPPVQGGLLVELCSGEGLLSRALLQRFPDCRVLALDGSPSVTSRPFAVRIATSNFQFALICQNDYMVNMRIA